MRYVNYIIHSNTERGWSHVGHIQGPPEKTEEVPGRSILFTNVFCQSSMDGTESSKLD